MKENDEGGFNVKKWFLLFISSFLVLVVGCSENGGHLIVQYHTINDGFSESMAPYPLTIGRPSIKKQI